MLTRRIPQGLFATLQQRHFFSTRLGHTSVFLQTGLKIRELPMVVKKVNDVLNINISSAKPANSVPALSTPTLVDKSVVELIEKLNNFHTVTSLFRYLEAIPAEKVTPSVAIHALKRIIFLNNNLARRNIDLNGQLVGPVESSENGSFLRFAFINMLLDIVYRSRDPRVILDGLKIVCQDNFSEDREQIVKYKEWMYEETLELITDGLFSLTQVCEAVVILSKFYESDRKRSLQMADKLWTGIMDKAPKELNASSITAVFNTLPHLTSSRDLVFKLVSNKACDMWKEFKTQDIMEILRVLSVMGQVQCVHCQRSTLSMICQWLSVNVHNLTEQEMLAVVFCMDKMEFVNKVFISTLERYMKARGLQIKERDLVAAICDFCDRYRIRSAPILEASGEYFIEHANSLNTPQINSIAKVFGSLNFHPPNGFKFWDKIEEILNIKFSEFPPSEIINLLLSFVYLERFPVNLVQKVYNPFFIDRMESQGNFDFKSTKSDLKLFHSLMRGERSRSDLEFDYIGHSVSFSKVKYNRLTDRRISRLASDLLEPVGSIVGDVKRVELSVLLADLLKNDFYCADMIIYPSVTASMLRFGRFTSQENAKTIIVLIHPPEHYDITGNHLVGRQAMREKQMKKLGFKVMQVDYSIAKKLLVVPRKLTSYLSEQYESAVKS